MKLLHIDSSISGAESASRRISAAVVGRFKDEHPGLEITYRDVAAEPLPHHSEAILRLKAASAARSSNAESDTDTDTDTDADTDAGSGSGTDLDAGARTLGELSRLDEALEEFLAADVVVIGAPMYNFGIPSQLKSWIDALAVFGKTFHYTQDGPEGLAGGKRVIVASSRGGEYVADTPTASFDHQETYLTSFFAFLGVRNLEFVRAEGINYGPEQRKLAIDAALAEAVALKAVRGAQPGAGPR
ncbi:FMN-dependent NADH-azoreductase [Streptomyces sp. NPDC096310]|uniref:FMN-dependent NADH-azoreductase n=1 Tax=Streptomyces sp. NPDC096310 TaxID=3366082 RepID=UPI0037FA4B30